MKIIEDNVFHADVRIKGLTCSLWAKIIFVFIALCFAFPNASAQISQKIINVEYFFDEDPGFGKGIPVTLSSPDAQLNLEITGISTKHLNDGYHTLFVRVQSRMYKNGKETDSTAWSITQKRFFYRANVRVKPQVKAIEWFVDNDPGFGQATKVHVMPSVNTTFHGVNISLDNNLKEGVHTLYIRSLASDGQWSITQKAAFKMIRLRVPPNVVRLEWFIDRDPGIGQGTAVPFTGGPEGTVMFPIDPDSYSAGTHTLFVRALDVEGKWSITQHSDFLAVDVSAPSDISRVEYFIDNDPGFGQAHAVSFTPGATVKAVFDVQSDTLKEGLHTLYVRARNAKGQWALTQNIMFYRLPKVIDRKIIGYEYFIDRDPGFGQSPAYTSVTPAAQIREIMQVRADGLTDGLHNMFVRVKDNTGAWSIVQSRQFLHLKMAPLSPVDSIEWFIDNNDAGFGRNNCMATNGLSEINFPILADRISEGLHTLYVRCRNKAGQWSITQRYTFLQYRVQPKAKLSGLEWFIDNDPGFGQAAPAAQAALNGEEDEYSFILDLTNSGIQFNAFHSLYVRARNELGVWGITQRYKDFYLYKDTLKIPKVDLIEWFIDTDPGYGASPNQKAVTTPGRVVIQTVPIDISSLDEGMHRLFIRARDSLGHWSITHSEPFVKMKLISRDLVGLEWFIDNDLGIGQYPLLPLSGKDDVAMIALDQNTLTSVGEGQHSLYVRAKNNLGAWSITQKIDFYLLPLPEPETGITAIEWFVDIDKGFGKNNLEAVEENKQINKKIIIPTGSFDVGIHTIYIRVQTSDGKWSITQMRSFNKVKLASIVDLTEIEWFIDHDPGFGNGKITKISGLTKDTTLSVSYPNDLKPGIHTLYIRGKNSRGEWGISQHEPFTMLNIPEDFVAAKVAAVEWFFDVDPGYGKGTHIPVSPTGERIEQSIPIPLGALSDGLHTLFVRAIDDKNIWGVTHSQTFYKVNIPKPEDERKVVGLEWFLDRDPGFGNANAIDVPDDKIARVIIPVETDTIIDGIHFLYVRSLDSKGQWSVTQQAQFFSASVNMIERPNIVYLEWFISSDPGFGQANPIEIEYRTPDVVQGHFIVPLATLPSTYTLYIRALDDAGHWSITQQELFYLVDLSRIRSIPDIEKLEWFVDSDPGFGNANQVLLPLPNIDVIHSFYVPLDNIKEGLHDFYLRACNSLGEWSITQHTLIYRLATSPFDKPRNIVGFEYFIDRDPGFGRAHYISATVPDKQAIVTVKINSDTLTAGIHSIFVRALDNEDNWSQTQRNDFLRIIPDFYEPIVSMEWFIDDDPGFGNARQIFLNPEGIDVSRAFTINLPGDIAEGEHTLYIRAKNKKGIWAVTQRIDFISVIVRNVPNITDVEYFIDKDPGFGQGTPLPVLTPALELTTKPVLIPLDGVEPGMRTLYIRARSEEGFWSVTQKVPFINVKIRPLPKITKLEYFFDNDPGFGNATNITLGQPSTAFSHRFVARFPDSLSNQTGPHTLYVRALNEDSVWSITQHIEFLSMHIDSVPANIVAYEYFFDRDPGFGNGTYTTIAPAKKMNQYVQINTSELDLGIHSIFVRVFDSKNNWSHTQKHNFVRVEIPSFDPVVALEWFIDRDPGFGNAHGLPVGVKVTNIPIDIDEATRPGLHTLYVRAKNSAGDWSHTQNISFLSFDDKAVGKITAIEWFIDSDKGYGKADNSMTFPEPVMKASQVVGVDLTNIDDGFHTLFVRALNEYGHWGVTQYNTFVKVTPPPLPKIKAFEWFIDNDPGFGNTGHLMPIDAQTSFILNLSQELEDGNITDGTHTLYVRSLNEHGQWSITQKQDFVLFKDERNLPGITEIEWFVDDDPGYGQAPGNQHIIFATPQPVVVQPFNVDAAALSDGLHRLYIRARNTLGSWSLPQYEDFIKINAREVIEIEWFIDKDKGFGNNNTLPVVNGLAVFNVDESDLELGLHALYVRGKNLTGEWAVTQRYNLMVMPPDELPSGVKAVEWFVDSDPGFGTGKSELVTGSKCSFMMDIDTLSEGIHTLYVRALSDTNVWSLTQHIRFYTLLPPDTAVIDSLEWFIDQDLGFGLNNGVPVIHGKTIAKRVHVPLIGIEPGVHRIFTRVRAGGRWSLTQYRDFLKVAFAPEPSPITRLEWFVDNDPGFGNANQVGGFSPRTELNTAFAVNLDGVPNGMHTLYVRAQTDTGRWSVTQNISFTKVSLNEGDVTPLEEIEWFYDNDPGVGRSPNKIKISGEIAVKNFIAPLPDLTPGSHTFFVRAKDTLQHWGVTHYMNFMKLEVRKDADKIDAAEWFIDKDPGFGLGNPIVVSPATQNFSGSIYVRAEDVSLGTHRLYVRARNTSGRWAITQHVDLMVIDARTSESSKVMALEYFFDKDPGFGNATQVNITPVAANVMKPIIINADEIKQLSSGPHYLYLRAMNEHGQWSITQKHFIMLVTDVKSLPDQIVRIEYFFDKDDPGFGLAKGIDVAPDDNLVLPFFVDTKKSDNTYLSGLHTINIRAISTSGRWSITQYHVNIDMRPDLPDTDKDNETIGGIVSPATKSICQNESITLTASGYKSQIVNWEYQFTPDDPMETGFRWRPAGGADQAVKSFKPDRPGIWEYCVVVRNGNRATKRSTVAKIKVNAMPQGGHITGRIPEFVCKGGSLDLTLEDSKGEILKWWERNNDKPWDSIPNSAGKNKVTVTPDSGGMWYYRVQLKSECANAYSDSLAIAVIDTTTGGYVTPDTIHPCEGSTFDIEVKGFLGSVSYWQMCKKGQPWQSIAVNDKKYNVLATNVGDTILYRAVIEARGCVNTYSKPCVVIVAKSTADAKGLTGPDTICLPSEDVVYSVPTIVAAERYVWKLPAGVQVVGPDNMREIHLNFPRTVKSDTIMVWGTSTKCGTGARDTMLITTYQRPENVAITGSNMVYIGNSYTYTVNRPGMNLSPANVKYKWTVPLGWVIEDTSHSGRTIKVRPIGLSGDITCTAFDENTGCESEQAVIHIILNQCAHPSVIYRLPNTY